MDPKLMVSHATNGLKYFGVSHYLSVDEENIMEKATLNEILTAFGLPKWGNQNANRRDWHQNFSQETLNKSFVKVEKLPTDPEHVWSAGFDATYQILNLVRVSDDGAFSLNVFDVKYGSSGYREGNGEDGKIFRFANGSKASVSARTHQTFLSAEDAEKYGCKILEFELPIVQKPNQILSVFKGLVVISFPADWLENFDYDKSFGSLKDEAIVRFPNARAFALSVTHDRSETLPEVRELSDNEISKISFGKICPPFEVYKTAQIFGHSKPIELK